MFAILQNSKTKMNEIEVWKAWKFFQAVELFFLVQKLVCAASDAGSASETPFCLSRRHKGWMSFGHPHVEFVWFGSFLFTAI